MKDGTHFWLRRLGAIAVAVACVVLAALTGMAGFVGVGVLLVYRILKQPQTNYQQVKTENQQATAKSQNPQGDSSNITEEHKMAVLDSSESLVLGDILVTPNLTRSEAESALSGGFSFSGKTREESREYWDSVRVMFLYADIFDQPGRDVDYSFEDFSLFQKYDGSFFLVSSYCVPFDGGRTLCKEFGRDFLTAHTKEEVKKLFSQVKNIEFTKDFDALFAPRSVSFYAEQRYLCFDYRVLFHYSSRDAERLKEEYEEELSHAEKCIDSDIIKNHLTAEYEKALAAIKKGAWENLDWKAYGDLKRQEIAEYKKRKQSQQEQPSKFWEEGLEKAEAERWEEFLKSDEIFPETLPMADGTYRANFYLYEGKPALLPLDPTIFRQERDNGEILPFDEYRLVVITSTRATPTALDYKAAVALITLLLPNADFSVRTLSDGFKYLAINRLSGDELEHLIRAVRDAEKTNPYLAQDKQHSAEDAHGTKPPFDNLTFVSLGKDETPCGIFSVTAGKKAVLPADPRAI